MPVASVRIYPEPPAVRPQPEKVFIGISLKGGLLPRPERLLEVFAWTRKNVGSFSLLLGDHLNRHNYAAFEGMPEEAAESKAVVEGDNAATHLQRMIEGTPGGAAPILRASDLVLAPDYAEHHERFERQFGTDAHFRDLIQEGVELFMARNAVTPDLRANVEPHCIAYQMEELAIFEILAGVGFSTLVYPGAHLPVMKAFVTGQLTNISRSLESMKLIEIRVHEEHK